MFDFYRSSLIASGLSTDNENAIICPLCWKETSLENLSREHVVPGAVGGSQETLTCWQCNNIDGHKLDSHLTQFQRIRDACLGHGSLKTIMDVEGNKMTANLELSEGQRKFQIVAKATNPAAINAAQAELRSGNVDELNFTILLNYNKNRFNTALLRIAYLVLFRQFGYSYIRQEIVQVIRTRIADSDRCHPDLSSLVVEAKNFIAPGDDQYFIIQGNVNGVGFYLVIVRIRLATTSYFGVYMPAACDRCDEFFGLMELASKEHNGTRLTIPREAFVR